MTQKNTKGSAVSTTTADHNAGDHIKKVAGIQRGCRRLGNVRNLVGRYRKSPSETWLRPSFESGTQHVDAALDAFGRTSSRRLSVPRRLLRACRDRREPRVGGKSKDTEVPAQPRESWLCSGFSEFQDEDMITRTFISRRQMLVAGFKSGTKSFCDPALRVFQLIRPLCRR